MKIVWRELKTRLQNQLTARNFDTWIKPIQFAGQVDSAILLDCPNKFFIDWVRENYLQLMRVELNNIDLANLEIKLRVGKAAEKREPVQNHQLLLPQTSNIFCHGRRLNSSFRFENFVTGACNHLAYSAALKVSKCEQAFPNFLYFYSKTGLGKSHLSQAISAELHNHAPFRKVHYLTAEDFLNEMIFNIKQGTMDDFKRRFRQECDVLVLEEVHFLNGKEGTQGELTSTLDKLLEANKRVIFTSNKLPREIRRIDTGLRSRLNSGMIITIESPEFDTRVKILEKKAEGLELNIGRDLIEFIAHHLKDDVRAMESTLLSLSASSTLAGRPLNRELVQEVLKNFVDHQKQIDSESIKGFVAESFGISVDDMVSPSRKQSVTFPRNVAMRFCRSYTNMTLESIGQAFDRNHATVLYSLKSIDKKIKKDRNVRTKVELLQKRLEDFFFTLSLKHSVH